MSTFWWGGLIANGTSGEHIFFTSNLSTPAAGDWGKLFFEEPDLSALSYCDISYGGSFYNIYDDGSIFLKNTGGNLDISNCTITHSESNAINLSSNSYPEIDNCTFDNCNYHAIYSGSDTGHPTITNCTFLNTNSYPIVTYGDFIDDIAEKGAVLSGGSAMLKNLDKYLTSELNIPCYVAEDPLFCVIRGLGLIAENFNLYQKAAGKM